MKLDDIDMITLAALRYAMGRKTYIVMTVQDFILDNIGSPELRSKKNLILDSVKRFLDNDIDESLSGDTYFKESWTTFYKKLKDTLEDV